MFEQAHRLVRPTKDQFGWLHPSGFLAWNFGGQAIQIGRFWQTIKQGKRRVPNLGNHPVRSRIIRDRIGVGDQGIDVSAKRNRQNRAPMAFGVDIPNGVCELGSFYDQRANKSPHKAKRRGKRRTKPVEPHNGIRRAQFHGRCDFRMQAQMRPPRNATSSFP